LTALENGAPEGSWIEQHSEYRTVKLSRAIRAHGEDVRELRIREPCVEDLERCQASIDSPLSFLFGIIARCTGVPPSSIRLMRMQDVQRCNRALVEMGFTLAEAFTLLGAPELSLQATGPTGLESSPIASTSVSESSSA
jgi:Phage tail assembly chaperone proteins, E, or 41 or 14